MTEDELTKRIQKMHDVLFGDEEAGNMGMVKKVDVIYEVFTKARNGITFIGWTISGVIVLGFFIGTIKGWLVGLAHWILTR